MGYQLVRALTPVKHDGVLRVPGQTTGANAQDFVLADASAALLISLAIVSFQAVAAAPDPAPVAVYATAGNKLVNSAGTYIPAGGVEAIRPRLLADGDSQSKNGDVQAAGYRIFSSRGYWVHCLAEIGWPYELVAVPAVPGETMQQVLARFDASVAANRPDEVWLFAGQNNLIDVDNGVAFIAALREYALKVRAIGSVLRVFNTTPRYGAFQTTQVQRNVIIFQRAIADMTKEGLFLSSNAARSITDRTSATGSALTGLLYDAGIHVGAKGGSRIGRQFAREAAREKFTNPFLPPLSAADCRQVNPNSKQLLQNPLLTGVAGTVTAPAEGVAPDSWQAQFVRSGPGAAGSTSKVTVATGVADPDDPANAYLTLTFSGNKVDGTEDLAILNISAQFAAMLAAVTPETDSVDYARLTIKASNVSANFSYAKLELEVLNGSTPLYATSCMGESASDPQGEFSPNLLTFHAPGFVIPAGATRVRANLKIGYLAGNLAGVFSVSNFYCRMK